VVFKLPNPTKFRLANALFPGIPAAVRPASATEHAKSSGSVNVIQAELVAVEPASSTPSPTPSEEGAVTVTPLVVLKKGGPFGMAGTKAKFSSRKHATPPGLVEASWDSELSAKA